MRRLLRSLFRAIARVISTSVRTASSDPDERTAVLALRDAGDTRRRSFALYDSQRVVVMAPEDDEFAKTERMSREDA